jgi:predicted enzyme related to lactoylglutathione lyase
MKGAYMVNGVSLIVYPAADLSKAKAFFRELFGSDPYYAGEYYVGYKIGDKEIGLDPTGGNYGAGPIPFRNVSDIASGIKALVAAGGRIVQDVVDRAPQK